MSNKKIHVYPRELEKLNIENLFTTGDENRPYTDGKLDIETLFGKNSRDDKNFTFDSQVLLDGVKKRRQKLKEYCSDTYKTCCETIISANNAGLTDIIFEIPEIVPDCLDYKPLECLKYIEGKLKEQKISDIILSHSRIFITWNNLESKIKETNENLPNMHNETHHI
jgi:hypothetical protein